MYVMSPILDTPMKIIEYAILYAKNTAELDDEVNTWIKEGWQPFGGIGVEAMSAEDWDDKYTFLYQAIVKYEETPV